jgi:hypothetical protein
MIDQVKRLGAVALGLGLLVGGIYGWLYALVGLIYTPDKRAKVEVNRYRFMQTLFGITMLIVIAGVVVLTVNQEVTQRTIDLIANIFGAGLAAGLPAFFLGVGNPETNQELQQRIRINALLGLALAIGGLVYIL